MTTAQDWPLVPLGAPGARLVVVEPPAPPLPALTPIPAAPRAPARLELPTFAPAPAEAKTKLPVADLDPSLLGVSIPLDDAELRAFNRRNRLPLFVGLTLVALAVATVVALLSMR